MDAMTLIVLYALLRFVVPFVLLLMIGTWIQSRTAGYLRHV